MKIKCNKTKLISGISTVMKAVPSKSSMTILECILFTADENGIKLTANDMDLGIETYIDGEVLIAGQIALEAKMIFEIVRSFSENDEDVVIENEEDFTTYVSCGNPSFKIAGRSSEEFAYLPDIARSNPIEISQFSLKEVIKQTIFSVSDNDTNKIMTGEYFEINGDNFKVVSLDGHRISIRQINLKNSYDEIKAIVPGKTLSEISKIIPGDVDKDVAIFFTENHVIFEFDTTTVISRLIEGTYFRIDQMISNDYETKLEINKKKLLESISRATLLVKEGDKKPIIFTIDDENVNLKINSSLGSMNEDIKVEKSGKDIMIGFNPKFLIDAIKVIDDETITLYMVNPKAPCIIKNDDESYLYLVLPVNFNS